MPGHRDGLAGHGHGLQAAVRPALAKGFQAAGDAFVPQGHPIRLHSLTVDQRVRDGGGQMPIAHSQIQTEGKRVGLIAIQAFTRPTDIDVARLELGGQALNQGIGDSGLDLGLQTFSGHARFYCQRTIGVARDISSATADRRAEHSNEQEESE